MWEIDNVTAKTMRRLPAVARVSPSRPQLVAAGGFLIFRARFQQQIVTQTARHYFGRLKLNVLILGYQSDEETTDTIILAHLDVDRRTATLVSIPRDTWVPNPKQGSMKINAAYAFGGAHATARAVSTLLGGIPIDAIVALQPEGAAKIVDAMGGLDVNVNEDMDYDDNSGDLHIHCAKASSISRRPGRRIRALSSRRRLRFRPRQAPAAGPQARDRSAQRAAELGEAAAHPAARASSRSIRR